MSFSDPKPKCRHLRTVLILVCRLSLVSNDVNVKGEMGHFQSIKSDCLAEILAYTGGQIYFLSPMMFLNQYVTEKKRLSEFYFVNFLLLSIKFNTKNKLNQRGVK